MSPWDTIAVDDARKIFFNGQERNIRFHDNLATRIHAPNAPEQTGVRKKGMGFRVFRYWRTFYTD